jgi:OmcA/MtrC family decaheme c-type cytochrome
VTTKLRQFRLAATLAAATLMLWACSNDELPSGSTPPPGGVPVEVPTGPSPIRITANTPTTTFAALQLKVNVGLITFNGPPVVNFSITDLDGNAVIGFGSTSKSSTSTVASYPNLAFALAKLVPAQNGSPSKWVSYIVTTVPTTTTPAAPSRPSTDNTGTLVDNGNGTYAYTFYRDITKIKDTVAGMTVSPPNNTADLGDLTFDPTMVHRLTIQVSGSAPGTGTNTPNGVQTTPAVVMTNPVDVIHDFIPSTGQAPGPNDPSREIVATSKCNECHKQLGGIPGGNPQSNGAGFHGGNRNDTRYCVVCHTDQRRYGYTEATIDPTTLTFTSTTNLVDSRALGNLPNHIHHIHMGEFLQKKNYNYSGLVYNDTLFPQDIRNCTKCHDGSATSTAPTAQGNNWMLVPNRLACGACHDGINFATGTGVTIKDSMAGKTVTGPPAHQGGAQPDDSRCSSCHTPTLIDTVHLPVTAPNPGSALAVTGGDSNTNAAWVASNPSRMPAGGIAVTYQIQSVSLNASRQPVTVFRILQNGVAKAFNPAPPASSPASVLSTSEMWDGYFGSPSVQYVFAVPQDGITSPSDYNASASGYLRSIWNGTATGNGAGTLTGPDGNGFYTVTLTGFTIPTTATMLAGGIGFSYSLTSTPPLTQKNLATYPVAPATATGLNPNMPNLTGGLLVIAPTVTMPATGFSARRAIVEDARCDQCHQQLGAFTTETFHGAQRNDATTCSWCHNPNRASSGWTADSSSYIHAIHASAKRTVPFTWHATSPPPTPESFADIGFPGILAQCETCHLPGTYDFRNSTASAAIPGKQYRTTATGVFNPVTPLDVYSMSPYVAIGQPAPGYGVGFSYNVGTQVTTPAAPTTLVNSPIATACFACHDSSVETAHIKTNGGSIYAPRSTALATTEQCMICHGPNSIADIKVVHGIN